MSRQWIMVLLFSAVACRAAELSPQDREYILRTFDRSFHFGDPPHSERLTTYAERQGLRQRDVETFLLSLAKECRSGSRTERLRGEAAIDVLGDYRAQWALPELKALLKDNGEQARSTLIRNIVRIGGPELPQFAREMLDPEKTPRMERFSVYEELSAYVGVDTVQPRPLPDRKSKAPALKDEIMQVLKTALTTEPDPFHRKRIREILVAAGVDPASLPKEEAGPQSPEAKPKKDEPPPQAKAAPIQPEAQKPVEPPAAEPAAPAPVYSILPIVVLVLLVVAGGAIILARRRRNS